MSDVQYVQSDKGWYTYKRLDINRANVLTPKVGDRGNCRLSGHPELDYMEMLG